MVIKLKKKKKENKENFKFRVSDIINRKDLLNSTNHVSYITKGWAFKVRNRGINIAIIIAIIYFIIAISNSTSINVYNSNVSSAGIFFSTFGMGLLYAVIIAIIFNTVAFIIRMIAEIIQLLQDIKDK